MVEFFGEYSDDCKLDGAKKEKRSGLILWSISTLVFAIPTITVGIIYNRLILAFVVLAMIGFPIIIFLVFPPKNILKYNNANRITLDNMAATRTGSVFTTTKPLKKVKKVIDCGKWYYIIFKFGDITNAWVCQKDLIVKGTIEDFERLFEGKIVRKIK